MSESLGAHQVAGVEPDVAILEGVAHQLALTGRLVGVAVERRESVDRAQQQTRPPGRNPAHPPVGTAHRLARLRVVLDVGQRHRIDPGRSRYVEDVDETGVSLAGGIELRHPADPKPVGELLPDLRAEPVADDYPDLVRAIVSPGRLVKQIAAHFTDVDECGGV